MGLENITEGGVIKRHVRAKNKSRSSTRPYPTIRLIKNLCNDYYFISCVHHGISELYKPLSDFYPFLNLDELLEFSAMSWLFRAKQEPNFFDVVKSKSVSRIFSYTLRGNKMPWLNKIKVIPEDLIEKYHKLNHYSTESLRERLELLENDCSTNLFFSLLERETNIYVFECQYEDVKKELQGRRIKVMGFQSFYPTNKEKIIYNYAREISRIIRTFPKEVFEISTSRIILKTWKRDTDKTATRAEHIQKSLFSI